MSKPTRLPLMIGGVLRCCIATLDEKERPPEETPEGTVLRCNWCSSGLIVRDGAWRWPGPQQFDGER